MARVYRYLTYEDRKLIEAYLSVGKSVTSIAHALERNEAQLYRELKRGRDENGMYVAADAQRAFEAALAQRNRRKEKGER